MSGAYLDHIGIAVGKNSRLAELFAILGVKVTGKETVAREKVNVELAPLPLKQARLEFLQPTAADSTAAKFLAKQGRDGVHHLSFRVTDIAKESAKLAKAGFKMVYDEAKPGADECMVNFIHPASTGGVLVELSEKES